MLYGNRTVVLTFSDPTLPYQLSKLVKVSWQAYLRDNMTHDEYQQTPH
jgi:hypothetical protein